MADKAVVGGDEVSAFHDEGSNRWVKSTHPNSFGHSVEPFYSLDNDSGQFAPTDYALGRAAPSFYLDRLVAQNAQYGDDIRLHGVFVRDGKLHMVTSQPDIAGTASETADIREFMRQGGFQPIDSAAYYRPQDNTAVFDAVPSNFKKVGNNVLPIDVIPHTPSGDLKVAIEYKLARQQKGR